MKYLIFLFIFITSKASALCVYSQDGSMVSSMETLDNCSGYWLSSAHDIRTLSIVDLTPSDVASAFAFGVSSVLVFWFAGYGVKIARELISKI